MPESATKACLVIGWGNELRGDDAAGRLAVRELDPGGAFDVIETHQLTPEFAETMRPYQRVVFVDAYPAFDANATLQQGPVNLRNTDDSGAATVHHCTPEHLLRMSHDLYGATPEAWVVAIPAFTFEFGEALSAGTAAALQGARDAILEQCRGHAAPALS